MKYVKTFESFQEDLELNNTEELQEGVLRKFFTGHETPEAEKAAEAKFVKALEDAEKELKANPKEFAQAEKWDQVKAFLYGKASANRFRGGLRVQQGGRDDRYYIVYDEKYSGFQAMAASAATERDYPLGKG